jgi:hypothetical protein
VTTILLPVFSSNEHYSATDVAYLEVNPAFKSYLRIARKAWTSSKNVLSETTKLILWDERLGWLATETPFAPNIQVFNTVDLTDNWSRAPEGFDSGNWAHASVEGAQLVVTEGSFYWMGYLKGTDDRVETVSIFWEELTEL